MLRFCVFSSHMIFITSLLSLLSSSSPHLLLSLSPLLPHLVLPLAPLRPLLWSLVSLFCAVAYVAAGC